jgi:hypothetical protein
VSVDQAHNEPVDVDAVIAALCGRFDTDEAAIIERLLRENAGTVTDNQLLEEIGLALAIHRRIRGTA